MKAALAGLVMIGTAGGLGIVLPGSTAPYQIGHAAVPGAADPSGTDHVITYAAPAKMTAQEVTAWAGRTAWTRGGNAILFVYAPGSPVPDPSGAVTLYDALWISERGAPRWRVEISPMGKRVVTEVGGVH